MNKNLTLEQKLGALSQLAVAIYGNRYSHTQVVIVHRSAPDLDENKRFSAEIMCDGSYISNFDDKTLDGALDRLARDTVRTASRVVVKLDEVFAAPIRAAISLLGL